MIARYLARTVLKALPENDHLGELVAGLSVWGQAEVLTEIAYGDRTYPVRAIVMGDGPPDSPLFLVTAGVHGLERIGTRVALAYMNTVLARLKWDELARASLSRFRLAFVPLLNPVGMALGRRSNGNGVDLMRNAPVRAEGNGTPFVGGQRVSSFLPWYMGDPGTPMQPEASALVDFFSRHAHRASAVIALDIHSGFGMVDRLWFPYARTHRPCPELPELYALKQLLDRTLPNHVYRLEPQAQAYTIQGDLWDHLYDGYRSANPGGTFLPLTLEMGSWLWVKKNPVQAFSTLGAFNPIVPHRLRRTLRRHIPLLDFLCCATASKHSWSGLLPAEREALKSEALGLWYS